VDVGWKCLQMSMISKRPGGAVSGAARRPGARYTRPSMPADTRPADAWNRISDRLRETLNAGTYGKWFGQAEALEERGDRLVVGVPNEFTKTWIEGHFSSLLDAAAAEHDLVVELRVAVAEAVSRTGIVDAREAARPDDHELASRDAARADARLNPRYTFDVFVIGPSNRFAHAAALAVAESPAQAYNPLFVHGSTGLGKTHLLQAVGQYVLQQHSNLRVRYVTTETLMNEFVDALREKKVVAFKHRYRTSDVLLVDDIQFLEGKENLQEEFFHTFNTLYEAGKQIVIASDRAPKKLATLEERLRTRFEWGLTTDVQPPDLETRIAILRKKVITDELRIDDPEVLTFIADRVTTNIRELEGALTRVIAYASLTGRAISAAVAREVLKDLFPDGSSRPITIEHIQAVVCERFRVSLTDLKGDKRSQEIVYPRQIAMYLARELTDLSLPKIGAKFGGRDHSTVIHAKDKISRLLLQDREVFNLVQDLTARIKHTR
jgi:chromosomal replication initiator protein